MILSSRMRFFNLILTCGIDKGIFRSFCKWPRINLQLRIMFLTWMCPKCFGYFPKKHYIGPRHFPIESWSCLFTLFLYRFSCDWDVFSTGWSRARYQKRLRLVERSDFSPISNDVFLIAVANILSPRMWKSHFC